VPAKEKPSVRLSKIIPPAFPPDSIIALHGRNFIKSATLAVKMGEVRVPAANIYFHSDSALEVTIPSDAPLGKTTISVANDSFDFCSPRAFTVT